MVRHQNKHCVVKIAFVFKHLDGLFQILIVAFADGQVVMGLMIEHVVGKVGELCLGYFVHVVKFIHQVSCLVQSSPVHGYVVVTEQLLVLMFMILEPERNIE